MAWDEIPEWTKTGPIGLKNYDHRALWHGQTRGWGDSWPMVGLGTDNFLVWHEYFSRHLGGHPWAFSALIRRRIKQMNVPEARPEWFDPSFKPTPGYRVELPASEEDYGVEHRVRMSQWFEQLLDDLRNRRHSCDSGIRERAPVGTIFSNYDEAVRRHGVPRT